MTTLKDITSREGDEPQQAEVTAEEAVELAEMTEAHIMQILERGLLSTQLADVDVGPNRRPVWVYEHDVKINAFEALGYRIERSSEGGRVHPTGDDRIRLGDVILMSVDKGRYELICRAKRKRSEARRDAGRRFYKDKAEAHRETGGPEPIDEGGPKE